ncbi:MAG: transcriptional regulator [Cytophagales bacterium]|nr:MAG: transcriptional regulator [Cytophagales bacterium]
MIVKPIHTDADYKAAMAQMCKLWDCPEGSSEADLLEVLSILIEQYEKRMYPIDTLDPVEAIQYEMEENGLSQQDMVKYFGSKERVSEVLNRKRPLTLKMIKNLYHDLNIPASILLAR